MTKNWMKTGLAVGLAVATMMVSITPTYARDGGAIAAGVIGGAALGALAGSAAAGAYAAPPPPAYYPPPPPPARYVEPGAYAPPPPCHREIVRVWDPYAGVYVDRPPPRLRRLLNRPSSRRRAPRRQSPARAGLFSWSLVDPTRRERQRTALREQGHPFDPVEAAARSPTGHLAQWACAPSAPMPVSERTYCASNKACSFAARALLSSNEKTMMPMNAIGIEKIAGFE